MTETNITYLWAKYRDFYSPTFIGNDTIAIASGNLISFINIINGSTTYYRALGDEFGDGVSCIAGHRHLPIVAFGEICIRPRIFILSFPQFKRVQLLTSTHPGAYLQLRFSESEYLICLSGCPSYQLEIWNWRSGKLLITQKTDFNTNLQQIKVSRSHPLMVLQYSQKFQKLTVWESYVSMEQGFLIKKSVQLPFKDGKTKIFLTFGIDGNIYVIDQMGTFYCINITTGVTKQLWKWTGLVGQNETAICYFKSGFLLSLSSGNFIFLKKVDGVWSEIWSIQTHYNIYFMRVLNDNVYCITRNAHILKLTETGDSHDFIAIGNENHFVKFFEILCPAFQHVVTVSEADQISLLQISTGDVISSVKKSNISYISPHPLYPVLGIGDQRGIVYLLSFSVTEEPKFLTEFHLSEHWIIGISFSESGTYIIVRDRIGDFFILHGNLGEGFDIILHHSHPEHIFAHCLVETDDDLKVIILTSKKESELAAKMAEIVTISKSTKMKSCATVDLPGFFTSIVVNPIDQNELIAAQYLSNELVILKMHKDTFSIEETLKTFHQFKFVCVHCTHQHILTWGMDGLICIFGLAKKTLECVFVAHSRREQGIRHARCDPFRQYCLSLGFQGNLKCAFIRPNNANSAKLNEILEQLSDPAVQTMLSTPIRGFKPEGDDIGKTWLELIAQRQFEKETEMFAAEKSAIYEDFKSLQIKLKKLIDKNEKLDKAERLHLQNFNLSKDWSESLLEMARRERDLEDRTMKAHVADQQRIAKWIIENTWKFMEVKGRKLRGIFSKISTENYALTCSKPEDQKLLENIKLWRLTEKFVSENDSFLPWNIGDPSQVEIVLSQRPRFSDNDIDFKPNRPSNTVEDETLEQSIRSEKGMHTLSGTSTHKYIEPLSMRYDQLEVVSFHQMYVENIMGQHDMLNLRMYFNNEFGKMMQTKEDEIKFVRGRNERLRYIQNELNTLAKIKNIDNFSDTEIIDPDFEPDELPDSIIKVDDWEVPIKPYISPSLQNLLDEQAYEQEQRRLALLADDFRDRALTKMMDGVLERRWEDEIIKDPPKPECLIKAKDISEYTKEDMAENKQYQERLKFLQNERERYRVLLEDEQLKLQNAQTEQIIKFNFKCAELCMLKFRVDAALRQEEMKLLRNNQYNYERIVLQRKEEQLIIKAMEKNKEIDSLTKSIEELEKRLLDCRNRYEQLQTKDRTLDRQFKSQFSEWAPQLVVDQAYKIFKKRPKWQPRAWATYTILTDLSIRISTKNSSRIGPPLPEECYEFLALVDSTENYNNAPNTIDHNLWNILCRMRRYKMESEFKLKACGAQLAEAESTLNAFQKELNSKKTAYAIIESQKDELKQNYNEHLVNRTVQIVMQRGEVEIPLSGRMSDFENCVLLNAADVGDINAIIKKAGQKKLQTMFNSAVFRRKIIYKEWEHKVLRMTVDDLADFLNVIENCKVTKEIQMWLKRKELGKAEDLSQAALNREVEAGRKYLKDSLVKVKKDIEIVKHKIEVKKRENCLLDKKIQSLNIDVTEQNLMRDQALEEKDIRMQKERIAIIIERGKLVRKVQAQHAQILELATMLELQRLRTYPTLTLPQKTTSTKTHDSSF